MYDERGELYVSQTFESQFSLQTGITRIWKHKMIIGMPIFIHKKTTLYKNIYCYTKTITINRESYQFSLTYN